MKNTKIVRLLSVLVFCMLLVGVFAGVSVSADNSEYTLDIDQGNIAYNDMLHLAFTLKGTLPEGAIPGIITWKGDTEGELTVANASYKTFESFESNKITYYKTQGIAATDIDEIIYAAACYKYNGQITVSSKPMAYSVIEYAGKRLAADKITEAQASLYNSIIKYAISSNKVFDKSENYACVKAVGGGIGGFLTEYSGWAGYSVTLRADATNSENNYFLYWQNANGEAVSANRLYTVECPESGIDVYTAVYGNKNDSAYKDVIGFEGMDVGEISMNGINVFQKPNEGAYNTKYDNKYWLATYDTDGTFTISSPVAAVIDANKNPLLNPVTGRYDIRQANHFYITESLSGDKNLFVGFEIFGRGYSVGLSNPGADNAKSFEVDFTYHNKLYSGVGQYFILTIKNSEGKSCAFRVNLERMCGDETIKFKDEPGDKIERIGTDALPLSLGETATLRVEINGEKKTLEIYYNGEYAGALDATRFAEYKTQNEKNNFTFDETCVITAASLGTPSGNMCDFSIDNVTFYNN